MQASFVAKSTDAIRPGLKRKSDLAGLRRRMSSAIPGVLALAILLGAGIPATARAAIVSGTLAGYEGKDEPSRDLHFENCITHDEYLAPTHADSSFAQNLPPGCYDLRAEQGAILHHGIIVGDSDIAIGTVSDLAPLAPARIWNLEALFPTLLTSPAPSTAYIFTHDPTVVPASAAKIAVPTSESEWLKLQKQTDATTKATTPPAPTDFQEPMDLSPPGPMEPVKER
jgi:hypothetical protein